jgi:hypothetical protein
VLLSVCVAELHGSHGCRFDSGRLACLVTLWVGGGVQMRVGVLLQLLFVRFGLQLREIVLHTVGQMRRRRWRGSRLRLVGG